MVAAPSWRDGRRLSLGAPALRASGWKQRCVLLCDKRNNLLKSHGYLSCVLDCTGSTTTQMKPPSTAALRTRRPRRCGNLSPKQLDTGLTGVRFRIRVRSLQCAYGTSTMNERGTANTVPRRSRGDQRVN